MFEPYVGTIMYFAFDREPRDWAFCDGRLVSTTEYNPLFSLIGYTFGGSGSQFALPNLKGRFILAQGANVPMGVSGGAETALLTMNNMASHNHTVNTPPKMPVADAVAIGLSPENHYFAKPSNSGNMFGTTKSQNAFTGQFGVSVNPIGSATPFSTVEPYIVIRAYISLRGIYPSRP